MFVAFGYIGLEAVNRSTAATLEERRSTTLVVARHMDELIHHAEGHLIVVASQLVGDGQGESPSIVGAGQTLDNALHHIGFFYRRLLVFDAEGRFVAAAPAGSVDLEPYPDVKAAVAHSLQFGEPTISNLLRLTGDGARGVVFVVPIHRDGHVEGVVLGEMPMPHPSTSTIASVLELGSTGHMEVVDGQGWVLASTSTQDVYRRSEHYRFYAPLLEERARTVGRAAYEHDHDHDEVREDEADSFHIMAFVPLASAPWGVGLGQDENETLAAGRRLRDRTLGAAAAALVLALGFAWLGTRSVVRPLRELTRDGERMATGDLTHPIRVAQPDEIGGLASVLELMRRRLARSLAEITAWNRQLEERVDERTRELGTSNRHLRALTDVATRASAGGNDREPLLRHALRRVMDALGIETGWVLLGNEDGTSLRLAVFEGAYGPSLEGSVEVRAANAPCRLALESDKLVDGCIGACPALPPGAFEATRHSQCWCAPIRTGSLTVGVLCVTLPEGRALSDDEHSLATGVAHQLAVAFDNARLTEETTRLETARRAEIIRAELLASVSHELRTPLGFIKGYATTLLRDDVRWTGTQQREFLTVIDEECDHLAGLVDSLLEAGRVQAGRLYLERRPVDMRRLVESAVARWSSTNSAAAAGGRFVQLSVDPTWGPNDERAVASVDQSRIEQVVLNLIQNAVKYSPDGVGIDVLVNGVVDQEQATPLVELAVADRGLGIPRDELERIFEPFYRVRSNTASTISGTGLGLAISRAIVEAHGGRIWAENRQGGGTVIRFTCPRWDTSEVIPQPNGQLAATVVTEGTV